MSNARIQFITKEKNYCIWGTDVELGVTTTADWGVPSWSFKLVLRTTLGFESPAEVLQRSGDKGHEIIEIKVYMEGNEFTLAPLGIVWSGRINDDLTDVYEISGPLSRNIVKQPIKTTVIGIKYPDARGRYTIEREKFFIAPPFYSPRHGDRIWITQYINEQGVCGFDYPDKEGICFQPANRGVKINHFMTLLVTDVVYHEGEISSSLPKILDYKLISRVETTLSEAEEHEKKLLESAEPLKPLTSETPLSVEIPSGELRYNNGEVMSFDSGKLIWDTTGLYAEVKSDSSERVPLWITEDKAPSIKVNENMEDKSMKNMFGDIAKNFQFGQVDSDKIAYSMNGIAFKTATGDYVVYKTGEPALNVSNLVVKLPMFAMPVALSQLAQGDVIVHNEKDNFVVVQDVGHDYITAIEPARNEIINIVPQKSLFGFDFVTKIVAPTTLVQTANKDNPFGNMLPFMLMGDNMDSDALMMMAMCGGQNMQMQQFLPFLMMKDGANSNTMLALMMMQGGAFNQTAQE